MDDAVKERLGPQVITPMTCGLCGAEDSLHGVGVGLLCLPCMAQTIVVGACDLWPSMISYCRAFEAEVLL